MQTFFGKKAQNKRVSWNRRQKRFFQRSLSGIELAFISRERVRVMCLTSSDASESSHKALHRHFSALVKRIRRRYGKFEYIGVKEFTRKGLLHLHLLFRGVFISQRWLSDAWFDLHGAFRVFLQQLRGRRKRIGAYLCKYLVKEPRYSRYWCSWGWVYRGFVRDWKMIVHRFQQGSVRAWNRLLRGQFLEFPWGVLHAPWVSQSKLGDLT